MLSRERGRAFGPETVAERVLRRIAPFGDHASALARSVAVLCDAAALRRAAEIAGLTVEEAEAAASVLRRVGILQRRGALAFVHPVVRSAVRASLGDAERERGHAHAAALLRPRTRS